MLGLRRFTHDGAGTRKEEEERREKETPPNRESGTVQYNTASTACIQSREEELVCPKFG